MVDMHSETHSPSLLTWRRPGTYALAEYIRTHLDAFRSKAVLELGAATGVLSVYLHKVLDGSDAPKIYTSDIDDDGQVEENIRFNYAANNIPIPAEFPHIAHTWGREWTHPQRFDVVVASDILLYVSAYADLVKSVAFLFASRGASVFFMSWKRRIADSSIFFNMMVAEGFLCTRYSEDQCIYIFTRPGAGLGSSATTDRLS